MTGDEKRALLPNFETFAHVAPNTLQEVADALEARTIPEGEFLFREGDPGGYIFLVADGALEVRKRSEKGTEVILRVMGSGEVGGLTSTSLDRPRSATLRARRDTQVLTIERERFLSLLDAHPDLVRSVLAFLGGKVRGKTAQLATLMARDHEESNALGSTSTTRARLSGWRP